MGGLNCAPKISSNLQVVEKNKAIPNQFQSIAPLASISNMPISKPGTYTLHWSMWPKFIPKISTKFNSAYHALS